MLTTQRRKRDRVALLERALVSTRSETAESDSARLLLEAMSVDAQYWIFGDMKPLQDVLTRIRNHLQWLPGHSSPNIQSNTESATIDSFTDLEVSSASSRTSENL